VKEQQQEIDELKKKNANLEARLAKIEKMFALTED
jgi:Tfp pilus assembly protein PilN